MEFNELFIGLKRDSRFTMKGDIVNVLQKADVNFVEYYDISEKQWHIDIGTDDPQRILSLGFTQKGRFNHLYVVHSNFDNLVWDLIMATFAAQQFDFVRHNHGNQFFPIKRFDERRNKVNDDSDDS